MSSAICFHLDQSKILSSGNGLRNNRFIFYYFFLIAICVLFSMNARMNYDTLLLTPALYRRNINKWYGSNRKRNSHLRSLGVGMGGFLFYVKEVTWCKKCTENKSASHDPENKSASHDPLPMH